MWCGPRHLRHPHRFHRHRFHFLKPLIIIVVVFSLVSIFKGNDAHDEATPVRPERPSAEIAPDAPEAPIAPEAAAQEDGGFPWGWLAFGVGFMMLMTSFVVMAAAVAWVYFNRNRNGDYHSSPKRKNSFV